MTFTLSNLQAPSAIDAAYFAGAASHGPRASARSSLRDRVMAAWGPIRAKYDAAQTTDENSKHWANADDLSARMANRKDVRDILRKRARYERDNNSYLKGMVKTYANEVVGTGPRLQVQTSNEAANRVIEQRWRDWTAATDLPAKLRMIAESRLIDGEMFAIFTSNPILDCPVKLDFRLIEADQVTTPFPKYGDITAVDGIRFDAYGNPSEYDILPYHPGGSGEFGVSFYTLDPIVYRAEQVLHWFRLERAGQARGIPDITPALPLFAQLRRYTLAVLMAAELAASFAAIIKTDYPPNGDAPADVDPFEVADIVRGMFQMLPAGTSMQQFKAEQPITGYGEFVDRILKEASRSLEMPFGTATGDSSQYNYSSGRLDVQAWMRKVTIERSWHARYVDRVFKAWIAEASRIHGYLPVDDLGPPETWSRQYHWDGFKHVDPSKESAAIDAGLRNLSVSLTSIAAEEGNDVVEKLTTISREVELCKKLNLPHPALTPATPAPADGKPPFGAEEEAAQPEADVEEEAAGVGDE